MGWVQVMDKQLHELSFSIQQKEELIQELARNEAEAKHLTQQYESRMLELEAEVSAQYPFFSSVALSLLNRVDEWSLQLTTFRVFLHVGLGGYSLTSLPQMFCLLQMRRKEEEVEALKKELEAIDKNALRGLEEKKRLREQYEEKVKKITDQLIALKKQRWEQESQRLEQQKAKSDVKVL
jgi:DNA repair exonuclease SbcCD ATPase subunit